MFGRSRNYIRQKELKNEACNLKTLKEIKENPYFDIWDVSYFSTSDEEDEDDPSSDEDSDSSEEALTKVKPEPEPSKAKGI